MKYTIYIDRQDRHHDHVEPHADGLRHSHHGDEEHHFDTEEDGYPVVIMESGVQDFDEDAEYFETRKVCREPAKTWEEALKIAGDFHREDERLAEDSPLHGELESGDPDFWGVEVLKLISEDA